MNEQNNENLSILFCKDCNSIFKYRYQYHTTTGLDCFEVYPGEKERDIEFTIDEFIEVIKEFKDEVLKFEWDDMYCFGNMKMDDLKCMVDNFNSFKIFYIKLLKGLLEKNDVSKPIPPKGRICKESEFYK